MEKNSLAELQRRLQQEMDIRNNTPLDDFLGLSPIQVSILNRSALRKDCVLRWQGGISADTLAQVPLLTLAVDLMKRLEEKPLKLTAKGNLPGKLVKEWYATGLIPQQDIESGITKLSSEDDYYAAKTLKHVLEILRWTKKRHNKLSLTSRGQKMLDGPRQRLLEEIFQTHFERFNLGYFDGHDAGGQIQHFYGFVLVSLLKMGDKFRPVGDYPEALARAFPALLQEIRPSRWASAEDRFNGIVTLRFFKRSLDFYGLLKKQGNTGGLDNNWEVMATNLFRQLFCLELGAR